MIQRFDPYFSMQSRLMAFAIKFLPRAIAHQLLRDRLNLPNRLPEGFTIKLAETQEEYVAAFKLLHDTHVQARLISPEPSGLRITLFHALPYSRVIIALHKGQVVGTVSLTPDSEFGLPISTAFDLSELRRSGRRIVEAYGLALHSDYREDPGQVVLPLFKYIYQFALHLMRADHMVIALDPSEMNFYEGVLLFTPLSNQTQQYAFVNGIKTAAAYLSLKTYRLALKAVYKNSPPSKDPVSFLNYSFGNLKFPEVKEFSLLKPAMSAELLDYFFNKRTNLLARLSHDKGQLLASFYNFDQYNQVFHGEKVQHLEREARFELKKQARILTLDGDLLPSTVLNISRSGFKAEVPSPLEFGQQLLVTLAVDDVTVIDLRAVAVRCPENSMIYGFMLKDAPVEWQDIVEEMRQQSLKEPVTDLSKRTYRQAV